MTPQQCELCTHSRLPHVGKYCYKQYKQIYYIIAVNLIFSALKRNIVIYSISWIVQVDDRRIFLKIRFIFLFELQRTTAYIAQLYMIECLSKQLKQTIPDI